MTTVRIFPVPRHMTAEDALAELELMGRFVEYRWWRPRWWRPRWAAAVVLDDDDGPLDPL